MPNTQDRERTARLHVDRIPSVVERMIRAGMQISTTQGSLNEKSFKSLGFFGRRWRDIELLHAGKRVAVSKANGRRGSRPVPSERDVLSSQKLPSASARLHAGTLLVLSMLGRRFCAIMFDAES